MGGVTDQLLQHARDLTEGVVSSRYDYAAVSNGLRYLIEYFDEDGYSSYHPPARIVFMQVGAWPER